MPGCARRSAPPRASCRHAGADRVCPRGRTVGIHGGLSGHRSTATSVACAIRRRIRNDPLSFQAAGGRATSREASATTWLQSCAAMAPPCFGPP